MRKVLSRGWLVVVAVWILVGAAARPASSQGVEPKTYPTGTEVKVGDLTYRVERSWWEDFPREGKSHDYFLGVELSVRNNGSTTVQIPPFSVVDSDGRDHGENYSKIVWPKMSINPGEELSGKLYFHPPRDLSYRLLVSGGYLTKEFASVELKPKEKGS